MLRESLLMVRFIIAEYGRDVSIDPVMLHLSVFRIDLLLTHAFRHEALIEESDHELIFRRVMLDLGRARLGKRVLSDILRTVRNFRLQVTLLRRPLLLLIEQGNLARLTRFESIGRVNGVLLSAIVLAEPVALPGLVDPDGRILGRLVGDIIACLAAVIADEICVGRIEHLDDVGAAMYRLLEAVGRDLVRQVDWLQLVLASDPLIEVPELDSATTICGLIYLVLLQGCGDSASYHIWCSELVLLTTTIDKIAVSLTTRVLVLRRPVPIQPRLHVLKRSLDLLKVELIPLTFTMDALHTAHVAIEARHRAITLM